MEVNIRYLVPRRCMYNIYIDVNMLCVYVGIKYEYTKWTKKKMIYIIFEF